MRWGNFVTAREIGDRARDLQDAMESSRAQLQWLHGRAHERLTGRIQFARFAHAHIGRRHIGVAYDTRIAGLIALVCAVAAARFPSLTVTAPD